ncbi:uncharacterized protein TRAVEDRAFT_132122, partial [Trametes versicolor FP-101664 SS1]|uniref:uncharacterized protein n=1 Tax=Trametes versicolor (strain FP-101664) TaxID=717944 RepID=UPI0004623064
FPNLLCMAIDFLTLPATVATVEHTFSLGRLLLPHMRSRMCGQTSRALLCLKIWSEAGFVKQTDANKVAQMEDLDDD